MINELIKLMQKQNTELKELLNLLEDQYTMIMKKDVFGLEGLVDKINECGKKIAKDEVERRNLTEEKGIKNIVNESNDKVLTESYQDIQKTLNQVISQKETNDLLLKQEIVFNNKMIQLMNPNRGIKTYNSYGNLSR